MSQPTRATEQRRNVMRYALASLVGTLVVLSMVRADEPVKKEKESLVKPIDLKDVAPPNIKGGIVAKPLVISAASELEVFPREAAEKVAKQVDFSKQKLV